MAKVVWIVDLYCESGPGMQVELDFPRPEGWADATIRQRQKLLKMGPIHEDHRLMHALVSGRRLARITPPVCECIVQKNPDQRDPALKGANNICRRCAGPLP